MLRATLLQQQTRIRTLKAAFFPFGRSACCFVQECISKFLTLFIRLQSFLLGVFFFLFWGVHARSTSSHDAELQALLAEVERLEQFGVSIYPSVSVCIPIVSLSQHLNWHN